MCQFFDHPTRSVVKSASEQLVSHTDALESEAALESRTYLSRRSVLRRTSVLGALFAGAASASPPREVGVDIDPNALLTKLVRRTSQGLTQAEVQRAATLGYKDYLEYQLNPSAIDDSAVEARVQSLPTMSMTVQQDYACQFAVTGDYVEIWRCKLTWNRMRDSNRGANTKACHGGQVHYTYATTSGNRNAQANVVQITRVPDARGDSRGGLTTWENVVAACSACNLRKSDRLPAEAHMWPAVFPYQPNIEDLMRAGRHFPPNYLQDSWMDYLYWDSVLEP